MCAPYMELDLGGYPLAFRSCQNKYPMRPSHYLRQNQCNPTNAHSSLFAPDLTFGHDASDVR